MLLLDNLKSLWMLLCQDIVGTNKCKVSGGFSTSQAQCLELRSFSNFFFSHAPSLDFFDKPSVEYFEMVKLHSENLGERKTIDNFILSERADDLCCATGTHNIHCRKEIQELTNWKTKEV